MGTGLLFRLIAAGSFAAAPVTLHTAPAAPAIATGDAAAEGGDAGLGVGFENTGGNVQGGKGRSESRVVIGPPAAAPSVVAPLAAPAAPRHSAADAVARARAQVDAARAQAQAQIDAARARAAQAVYEAQQRAEEAQAQSRHHRDDARTRAEANSAQAHNSYTAD